MGALCTGDAAELNTQTSHIFLPFTIHQREWSPHSQRIYGSITHVSI